jgi:hypothetical protein
MHVARDQALPALDCGQVLEQLVTCAQGTNARNMNAANSTRCTAPCIT